MTDQSLIPAAAYARFSTDLQNERSTEDQIDLCRTFAQREGFHLVATYQDQAKSGASLHGRDGIQHMLADALSGKFKVIIVEELDRLSRDMEDMAGIHKRLSFKGVRIVSVHSGEATTLTMGMRALFAQLFREDNVHKVRRGMTGLIKQGLTAGGRAYGYRPDPANPGKPIIVPEEMLVVRRVFKEYRAGISPKGICRKLNADGIKPPRGSYWAPSALLGYAVRGTGMLRNPIFVGKIVWNKVRMVKDPSTGRRISRPNPESEWQVAEAPELRIIPDDLWEAVQAQLKARSQQHKGQNPGVQRRPKGLLSGLLKCGACGSGMAVAGVDRSGRKRLRCSAHTNSGTCPNPKTFYLNEVEDLVIDSLTKEMAQPKQIYRYAKVYLEKRQADLANENRRRFEIEARIEAITKDNQRLLDWALKGIGGREEDLLARMDAQGEERNRLRAELEKLPEAINIAVHPATIEAFAQKLSRISSDPLRSTRAKLAQTLYMLADMGELSTIIRDLIESITLYRDDDGGLVIKVSSWLAPLLKEPGKALDAPEPVGAAPLVAEEGLEPPTRGL